MPSASTTLFPYTTLFRSFGLELEKALDREESLEYPLGVVEAVHADADQGVGGEAVPLAHVGAAFPQRFLHRLRVERPFYREDRKSTRLNSSHTVISYAVF